MNVQDLMDLEYAGSAEGELRRMGKWNDFVDVDSEEGMKNYEVEVYGQILQDDYKIYEVYAENSDEAGRIARSIARDEFEDIEEINVIGVVDE